MDNELTQCDRVSYSESCKINTGNYESRDVYVSYSTDVRREETVEQALKRASEFVTTNVREEELKIRSGQKGVELPTPANCGNMDELNAEVNHLLNHLKEKNKVIADNAIAYLGENPTKEMLIKAIKTAETYLKNG